MNRKTCDFRNVRHYINGGLARVRPARTVSALLNSFVFRWRRYAQQKGATLSDWLHNLPLGWMALVFFGCAYLSTLVIYALVVEFPTAM